MGKLRVFFRHFLSILLLRFSSLLDLDEEELLLEEVEVELLLLFRFLLFILGTFLRPLFSFSFSGVLAVFDHSCWILFQHSHNSFGSAGLAPFSSRGENLKRTERPRN